MDDALVILKQVNLREDEISRIPFESLMGIVVTRHLPWVNVIGGVLFLIFLLFQIGRNGVPVYAFLVLGLLVLIGAAGMFYFKTTTIELHTSAGTHVLISNSSHRRVRNTISKMLTNIPAAQLRARAAQQRRQSAIYGNATDPEPPTE
jgi:hypothetical protein